MSNMVPFNVPLGNRNVAGDFHRPYERVLQGNWAIQVYSRSPKFSVSPHSTAQPVGAMKIARTPGF